MSRFSVVLVLILLSLPAAAQQGQKDFPVIVPSDGRYFLPGNPTSGGLFRPVETLGFLFTQRQ
jgi:hypothetical protein